MKSHGGNMSHKKHRSGPWGQVVRKHRVEAARLLARPSSRRAQTMYASIRDLMERGK